MFTCDGAFSSVASTGNIVRTSLRILVARGGAGRVRFGMVKGALVGVLALPMVGLEGTGGAGDTFWHVFSGHSEGVLGGLRRTGQQGTERQHSRTTLKGWLANVVLSGFTMQYRAHVCCNTETVLRWRLLWKEYNISIVQRNTAG